MKSKMQSLLKRQKQEKGDEDLKGAEEKKEMEEALEPQPSLGRTMKGWPLKRWPMSSKRRWLLRFVGILFLTGGMAAHYFYGRPKDIPQEKVLLTYTCEQDASYTVQLHENDLFDSRTLGEGMVYSSKLTESITADFSASLVPSAPAMLGADYSLKIFIVGKQGLETPEEVYRKEFVLKEGSVPYEERESIQISERVTVDPSEYAQIVNQVEEIIGATTDELFYLEFSGVYYLEADGVEKEETFTYSLPLPMTAEVPLYRIEKVPVLPGEGSISIPGFATVIPPNAVTHPIRTAIALGVFLLLVSLLLFRSPDHRESVHLHVKEILRKYASRMARIKEMPSLEDKERIEVFSIDALFMLADERQIPVLYWGEKEGEALGNTFYALDKNRVYLYREESALEAKKAATTLEVEAISEKPEEKTS